MAVIIILAFIIISSIQLYSMSSKKQWKEATIYSVLMLVGLIYSLGIIYAWKLPTISKITTSIFEPIANVINKNSEE